MKVCHTLICFFFLSLQDGNTGVISAEIPIITGQKGGNITVQCSFYLSGKKKIFCKEECEEKDILIKTDKDRAQSGRYSITYQEGTFPVSSTVLYLSITNLTKSDSGRYKCGLDGRFRPDSKVDFVIRVEDAPTNLKPICTLSTSVPSASTAKTTKESLTSSPGSWTPSSSSPETIHKSEQQQTTEAAGSGQTHTHMLLYVGLTLGVLIVMLSVAVLIFCRKRNKKPKEPPVETEYADVKKANQVYDEIRQEEDRQSRSPTVEISTVYSLAKYTKPHAVETSDDYSLVTAVNFQHKSEDASNELTYSQVDFSNGAAPSPNSAPLCYADNVIYSVPRVKTSSGGSDNKDASSPLYSTVTLHQS